MPRKKPHCNNTVGFRYTEHVKILLSRLYSLYCTGNAGMKIINSSYKQAEGPYQLVLVYFLFCDKKFLMVLYHWSSNQCSFSPVIRSWNSHGTTVEHIVVLYKLCYYIPDGCQIKILDHAGLKYGSNMVKHRQI